MESADQVPKTPEKQLSTELMDLDSPAMDHINCNPTTKHKLASLKRKASQLLEQKSPEVTSLFLKWRLAVVSSKLEVRNTQKQALVEASNSAEEENDSRVALSAEVTADQKGLLAEQTFLMANQRILEQDLSDIVSNKVELQEAYINELRMMLNMASGKDAKIPGLKAPRLERTSFGKIVNEYLDTRQVIPDQGEIAKFCNVLGYWLPPDQIRCVHIVPRSWNTKDIAHMFGSDEPPLTSQRNGLSLQKKIEEAFDNCWIVIVAFDSVESNPTEWKIVLLNIAEKDKVFFTDKFHATDRALWKWRDIDNRKLAFRNDNRPARRFLYMRYVLAWLHASDKSWPGFKDKVPPGQVWASPNKPDGCLRKSILLELGKKTGDKLPKDLINIGSFEDPFTSSPLHDEIAGIRVAARVQDHLDGERDAKGDEKDSDVSCTVDEEMKGDQD